MNTNSQNTSGNNVNHLVDRLKKEDSNYAAISRGIQIMYWIFIPFFIFMTTRHYIESGDVNQIIGGASMIMAFVIFAMFFGKYYKEYKYVDYSLPTVKMLKKAAWRYKPFQGRTIWIVVALALMDFGLIYKRWDEEYFMESQFMYFSSLLFGVIIGLILWYFKYKPLRDEALRLISEIEAD